MSEEEFKPIRITLSDEAFNRLDMIMKEAAFRSYSSAIEECIRVVYDIVEDIKTSCAPSGKSIVISAGVASEIFGRIAIRLTRFTGLKWKRLPDQ